MSDSLPYIVLVGRPNVGKSTLFNRLIRSHRAITHDRPGVTRDRMEGVVRRKDLPSFGIVDTGGITLDAHAAVTEGPEGIRGFERDILTQAEAALAGAAAVAFVVDGRDGLLPLARKIQEECQVRISTGRLNRAMEEALTRHQPPVVKRVRAKFFYLTQAETAPPTFVFFVSDAERVPESYTRYLERALRKLFGISHAPMRIHLRSSHKKKS